MRGVGHSEPVHLRCFGSVATPGQMSQGMTTADGFSMEPPASRFNMFQW